MSVVVLTRYSGGAWEDISKVGKEAKRILEGHGASSWRIAQVHSGAYTGQWVAMVEFADWEAYGKAMQALLADSEYQKLIAKASTIGELEGRGILNVMDV